MSEEHMNVLPRRSRTTMREEWLFRVAYSSFLLASPRLMEPFYQIEIQAPPDLVGTCEEILSRRRGFIRQVGDEACGVV